MITIMKYGIYQIIMEEKIFDKSKIEIFPLVTMVNSYEASILLSKVKNLADILLPLHETTYAFVETISQ